MKGIEKIQVGSATFSNLVVLVVAIIVGLGVNWVVVQQLGPTTDHTLANVIIGLAAGTAASLINLVRRRKRSKQSVLAQRSARAPSPRA